MGRFDQIIARNKNPERNEGVTIGMGFGLFVIIVIILAYVTGPNTEGLPERPKPGEGPPPSTVEKRMNDVPLR